MTKYWAKKVMPLGTYITDFVLEIVLILYFKSHQVITMETSTEDETPNGGSGFSRDRISVKAVVPN